MAVKFETVKAGDILYDCHREKMGNTTMSALGVWRVRVVSVDATGAVVSWNTNPARRVSPSYFTSLRRFPPEWIYQHFRGYRCNMCHRHRDEGHSDTCTHPKAVRARSAP